MLKISYETVVLDNAWLKKLSPELPMIYGCNNPVTRNITVYKYRLANDLRVTDEFRNVLQEFCDTINAKEPEVIAHEMQHLRNAFAPFEKIARTQYEQLALHSMDEISALAAGFLHQHINPDSTAVAPALYMASEYYTARGYDKRFLSIMDQLVAKQIANGGARNLIEQNATFLCQPSELYSPAFPQWRSYIFTFGDKSVFSKKHVNRMKNVPEWDMFQYNMRQIQKNQNQALFDIIQNKLGRAR